MNGMKIGKYDKNIRYGFFNNMKYMFTNQWRFKKMLFFVQVIKVLSGVSLCLLEIFLSKTVLDALYTKSSFEYIIHKMLPILAILGAMKFLQYISETEMKYLADCLRYDCYIKKLNDAAIEQDYYRYISPKGKILRKRAEIAVGESGETGLNSFMRHITDLCMNLLGILSFSMILIELNTIFIAFFVISCAIQWIVAMATQNWIQKNKDRYARIHRKLNYMAYKTRILSNMKDIKMYDMSKWLIEHGRQVIEEADGFNCQIEKKYMCRRFTERLIILIQNSLAYAYLIFLMSHGLITIGGFAAYFAVITEFGEGLRRVIDLFINILDINKFIDDYRSYIDFTKQETEMPVKHLIKFPYTITFEKVCYKYPDDDRLIIDHVSFEIKSGQKFALVGDNGAGKTTLIKLMCGLLIPTSGRILLNGIDIKSIPPKEYYKLFSAVFQDIGILPASIAKNIALCVEEKIDKKKVWKCLQVAGLSEKVKKLPNGIDTNLVKNITDDGVDLSIGELQKLLLARALYENSEVLILDEPTASLDPIAESEIYRKYNEITGDKIAVFISHRLASTKFCDKILYLKGSRILEFGSHKDLIRKNGEYKRVFEIQSRYYRREKER